MRIYHSEMTDDLVQEYKRRRPERKLNVLQSFGISSSDTTNLTVNHRADINSVILDSGVWTLNNSKKPTDIIISIETYRDYLKLFGSEFDFYFNFDRDFSLDGFDENYVYQRQLERAGLTPVPVIHDIYNTQEVECYIDGNHPIVAIGSSQTRSYYDADYIIHLLNDEDIKVHLFGFSQFESLYDFPVFSCDSSNWIQVARRCDEILYWNPESKKIDKTESIALETMYSAKELIYFEDYDYQSDLKDYLWSELQLTHEDLLGSAIFYRSLVNTHYYSLMEDRITAHHIELGYSH